MGCFQNDLLMIHKNRYKGKTKGIQLSNSWDFTIKGKIPFFLFNTTVWMRSKIHTVSSRVLCSWSYIWESFIFYVLSNHSASFVAWVCVNRTVMSSSTNRMGGAVLCWCLLRRKDTAHTVKDLIHVSFSSWWTHATWMPISDLQQETHSSPEPWTWSSFIGFQPLKEDVFMILCFHKWPCNYRRERNLHAGC